MIPLHKYCCDRCGKDCKHPQYDFVCCGDLVDLKKSYQVYGVQKLCKHCGDKANKFVDYYGKKHSQDLRNLRAYLLSGTRSMVLSQQLYNSLHNAGYY